MTDPFRRAAMAALFLLLLLPADSGASAIRGTVRSKDAGQPLALVSIYVEAAQYRGGVISNQDGSYQITDLPPGTARLRFVHIGYETRQIEVSISPEVSVAPVLLDVLLEPQTYAVPEIEVESDRYRREKEVQTGLVSLKRSQIEKLPSIGEPDPIRILYYLPGVQAASDISTGLYVRGGGPDQTLILLDEVPVYNPTHAFGFFSAFNSDVVEDVALYKGAYPARYGGRLGAVLDVTGREGARDSLRGKLSLSAIASRLTLEGPAGSGSWLLAGRRTYLEPFLNAVRNDSTEIPSYYFYDLNGRYAWNGKNADRFVVSGYGGRDVLNLVLDEDTYFSIRWGNRVASARYNRLIRNRLLATVQTSVSNYESRTDVVVFTTPISFENDLTDFSVKGDLTWDAGIGHTLSAGILASQYRFRFKQEFNEVLVLDYDEKPFDISVFAEDDWSVGPRTVIRSGLRTRYFSEGDRVLWEPRFALSHRLGNGLRAKAGGGVYHQYLQLVTTEGFSAGDFFLPIDETAEPGKSYQGVLGLEYEWGNPYQLGVEGYYTDLADLVIFDNKATVDENSFTAEDIFITEGEGYATGVELFAQKRTGSLTGWVGYTLGWTRRKFAEVNSGKEYAPKYDRRNDISFVTNYERGKYTCSVSFLFGTGQAFTPTSARYGVRDPATGDYPEFTDGFYLSSGKNSARLLPYHRLDVSLRRDFTLIGRPAQWFVQIFNVYNRRNEWFVQFDPEDASTEPEIVRQLPIVPSFGINFEF
ncbi:MAG: TonB-dependent receptor [Gemmatimonadetes bacterium]|nr:TonB-dependent receptor [Gemmatimonadota bacterium]